VLVEARIFLNFRGEIYGSYEMDVELGRAR